MYSPYCLTQVNCLLLFHCLGSLQWGRRGFLLYIYIFIYTCSQCGATLPFLVCFVVVSSVFLPLKLILSSPGGSSRGALGRTKLFPVRFHRTWFFLLLLLFFGRENGASPEMYFFFLNKKEGGEPVRGGDSRAVE